MQINELIDKLKKQVKKPVFLKISVAVGLLMIILILISDMSGKEKISTDYSSEQISFKSANLYAADTESQLHDILVSIEGVGKAKVMLTITSTEEYIFAETAKRGTSQIENNYVILDRGEQKEALVKKINNPAIKGVVIVCEGGDDPRVCEKIYKAVSTALDISTGRVYVTEMK